MSYIFDGCFALNNVNILNIESMSHGQRHAHYFYKTGSEYSAVGGGGGGGGSQHGL